MAKGRKQDKTPNKVFTGVPSRTDAGVVMNLSFNDKEGNRTTKPFLIEMRAGKPRFVEVEAPKSKRAKAVA